MKLFENQPFSGFSVLDRLNLSDLELTKEDAEAYVTQYYDYIGTSIEQHSKDRPESGYIALDVFVEKATGMVYQLLLLPSNLTKEVPWTVAQIGMKPEEVDKFIALSQSERKKLFTKQIVGSEAIHYLDHGYGAGIPAEKVMVDGLATGELPKMNSGDLFVMLMTKGSGGTYFDPRENTSRSNLPNYDMDATYAQLAEAQFGIDGYLANTVKEYYIDSPIFGPDGKLLVLGKHALAKVILDLAELKSGTWASNRGVSVVGHSMGGWEAIRAYLGEVFGHFSVGIEKYSKYLVDSHEESKKLSLSVYEQILSQMLVENQVWVERIVKKLGNSQTLFRDDNVGSKIILKDNEEQIENKSLNDILHSERPNMIFEALTPLSEGENAVRVRSNKVRHKRHVKLTSPLHAPELRMLISLRQTFGKLGGMAGYRLGERLKILDRGVNRLVEDSAFGLNMTRATHAVGLGVGLDAVIMNDRVLKGARGMSQNTIVRHSVNKVGIVNENGEISTISRLRVHAGNNDPVLDSEHMKEDALAMVGGSHDRLGDLFVMHEDGSHYLPISAQTQIWTEVFSRRKAVVEHRNKSLDIIARSFAIPI